MFDMINDNNTIHSPHLNDSMFLNSKHHNINCDLYTNSGLGRHFRWRMGYTAVSYKSGYVHGLLGKQNNRLNYSPQQVFIYDSYVPSVQVSGLAMILTSLIKCSQKELWMILDTGSKFPLKKISSANRNFLYFCTWSYKVIQVKTVLPRSQFWEI